MLLKLLMFICCDGVLKEFVRRDGVVLKGIADWIVPARSWRRWRLRT